MSFIFSVALWFILRGASCLVLSCSLSSCFVSPFIIVITSLGEEGAGLYVRGWLRLVIVELPGLFFYKHVCLSFDHFMTCI